MNYSDAWTIFMSVLQVQVLLALAVMLFWIWGKLNFIKDKFMSTETELNEIQLAVVALRDAAVEQIDQDKAAFTEVKVKLQAIHDKVNELQAGSPLPTEKLAEIKSVLLEAFSLVTSKSNDADAGAQEVSAKAQEIVDDNEAGEPVPAPNPEA